MKKILFVLLALFILTLAGMIFFVATFDADRYRPFLQKEAQKILGQQVEIGKISLGWRSGPALEVKGFSVASDNPSEKPILAAELLGAQMDWAPLLQGRIEVSSIFVNKPRLHLIRRSDGSIKIFENAGTSDASGGPAAALSLLIESVHIRDGEISFRDQSLPGGEELVLRDLDIKLTDVSLGRPVPLEAKASLLSPVQNLRLSGEVQYFVNEQALGLQNFRLETDLRDLEAAEIARVYPDARKSLAGMSWQGQLSAVLDALKLSAEQPPEPRIKVSLRQGELRLPGAAPLQNLDAGVVATSRDILLEGFSADFAGGRIGGSGELKLMKPEPQGSFKAVVSGVDLERLAPASQGEPQPSGLLTLNIKGDFWGTDPVRLQQTLSGQGEILIKDGKIRNLNVIREIMQKLSIVPGLVKRLQERLPASYQEKLERRDTLFAPIQIPFVLASGRINFPEIQIFSESFAITGNAQFDLAKNYLTAPMTLVMDPDLSAAFIRSVEELQYLTDRDGRLAVPFLAQGVAPDIRVQPDIPYITSRLAVAKTQEVLSGLFEKKRSASTGQTPQDTPVQEGTSKPAAQEPAQMLFGQLLQNVLGGGETADSAQQGTSNR